jgi:hypothetical protein
MESKVVFLETTFTPNPEQENFIDFVFSDSFSWYWTNTIPIAENKHIALTHTTRARAPNNEQTWGTKNSDYCDILESIFIQACAQINIHPKVIYRSAVNLTLHSPESHSILHKDHQFHHNNFILYLNEFTNAPTYVFADDKKTLLYESVPAKNKAIIFPGNLHAQGFCAQHERRVILVVTFN